MKMDLQNVMSKSFRNGLLILLSLVWAGGPVVAHAEASRDGSSPALAEEIRLTEEAGNQGRALLSVRDLKELLSTRERGPSSKAAKASQGAQSHLGANLFLFKMSKFEARKLWNKLQAIEAKREQLEARLSGDITSKKAQLRNDRKKIQSSRLSARESTDQSLGKKLFESILEESNLEAQRDQALHRFDEENAVSLDFVENNGQRSVEAIHIGDSRVWTPNPGLKVAKKN